MGPTPGVSCLKQRPQKHPKVGIAQKRIEKENSRMGCAVYGQLEPIVRASLWLLGFPLLELLLLKGFFLHLLSKRCDSKKALMQ
jgi:hypothetical protein